MSASSATVVYDIKQEDLRLWLPPARQTLVVAG